jgi:predicted dienelactone hydrolase
MTWQPKLPLLFLVLALLGTGSPAAAGPPSQFGADAPELARPGESGVGVRTLELVQRKQEDVLSYNPADGSFTKADRALAVDLWYPALLPANAPREVYTASFPAEPPSPPARFTVPGVAVRDAPAAGKAFPLVVISHGYSNSPAAMTWLTENLASKGYVVAAIRHDDPPITDQSKFAQLLVRRPLDVTFVTQTLKSILSREHLIDPSRVALIGYSMGGYGVLTAAGATLDPTAPATRLVPGSLLQRFARGGAKRGSVTVNDLRAVVAIAPAGGGTLAAWGSAGLQDIRAPLLIIAGDADRTVDYTTGAHAIFESSTGADRYLLTFKSAGHSLGLNPAPEAMRGHLWDQDWFEDPVWRKDRLNAINAHFITAFLDRYVKGDTSRDAYLNVPATESDAGTWPSSSKLPYDAYSPGTDNVTVWKGFQRNHAAGLELVQAKAVGPAN